MKTDEISNGTKESVVALLESQWPSADSPINKLLDSLRNANDSFLESRIKRDIITYIQSNTVVVGTK